MKSLRGHTTYATKRHKNISRNPPHKSHAYLAFTALLCCACLFASHTGTTILKYRNNSPPALNKPLTPAPTDTTKQRSGTAEQKERTELGARPAGTTPGETEWDRPKHRHTHTTKITTAKREKALPNCNYAHDDSKRGRASALTHLITAAAKRQDNGFNHHQNHTTLPPPTDTNTRTTVTTRGTYQWHPTEGNNSDDPTPLSLRPCHTTKAHEYPQGALKAHK